MALLPTFKRLNTNDYKPEEQDLVEQLGLTINDGMQSVYDALNRKLTFEENFLGAIKDVQVSVDATGKPRNLTTLITGLSSAPRGITVIQAENLTNTQVYPTGSPWVSYNVINNGIQIVNVTNLQTNNIYRLRILILG